MKTIFKIAGMAAVALLVFAGMSFMFKPDYANSSVSFKIKNASINVDGSFKTFETAIDFNETFNGPSYVKTTIQTTSVDTGMEGRDNHLRKSDFFDVAQFPTMTFESSKIRKSTNGSFIADGKLVIKGVSKDVSIPFTYTGNASSGVFEGGIKLNRLDYGVGGKSLTMSDDVEVKFKITASR